MSIKPLSPQAQGPSTNAPDPHHWGKAGEWPDTPGMGQLILPDDDLLPSDDLIPDELPSDHEPQVRPVVRSASTREQTQGRRSPRVSLSRSGMGF